MRAIYVIESKPQSAPASAWEPVACESYDSPEGAQGAAERLHRERERYPKPAGCEYRVVEYTPREP